MEFFAEADVRVREGDLHRSLRIDNLPQWCASIDKVLSHQGDRGDIYCIWGQFRVHREILRDGVRFTLPSCPNALQWTVTLSAPGKVQVHCTLSRAEADPEFVESIVQFVADWQRSLVAGDGFKPARPTPGTCTPWYG